ncbi:MAG TPA: antibiotic biosynthesis monooxygenase [Pseudolabrys sp.]|nr:antibiotic biosynthesis monooxygenase [Pseudolabrys sp.]
MKNPAVFVNCFEVPAGREDEFVALWDEVNRYMREKPGFVSNRLHRAVTPQSRYQFINYVEWATVEHWRGAHDEGFRALVQRPVWRDFPHAGSVCEVIVEHTAQAAAA